MTTARTTWAHFTIYEPRKRRAEVVCTICHRKKVKCDLAARRTAGEDRCTYCSNTDKVCEERQGKRANRHQQRTSIRTTEEPPAAAAAAAMPTGADPHLYDHTHSSTHLGVMNTPAAEPSDLSQTSRADEVSSQEDIDTGFLRPFIRDSHGQSSAPAATPTPASSAAIPSHLLHIFLETFFDSCYAWCPILDRHSALKELSASPLLANALAVVGSNLQPPIVPCDGPVAYYTRARRMFYEDEEPNMIQCVRAALLFYWWAPRPSSTCHVHRDSSWWWTSIVIRSCQQINFHRLGPLSSDGDPVRHGLKKRIWWTAFARERLTALCQSKPVIIHLDDCTIHEPSMEDFPFDMQHTVKSYAFLNWVRLCGIIGRIAKQLSRGGNDTGSLLSPSTIGPSHSLHQELLVWIQDLPPGLNLGVSAEYTTSYDKDICQLHLPYLTAVVVLDLQRAAAPRNTPQAGPSAMVAASVVARIFRDILVRGDTRFLMAITSWYCAVSFLALLSAKQHPTLGAAAEADIQIVRLMCDQLRRTWGSAEVVFHGIQRLSTVVEEEEAANSLTGLQAFKQSPYASASVHAANSASMDGAHDAMSFRQYFPFATSKTSELVELLFEQGQASSSYPFQTTNYPNYLATDMFDTFLKDLSTTDFSGALPNF